MKFYIGETGLDKTWQKDFPSTMSCHKCQGEARIMFVGFEDATKIEKGCYICNVRGNGGKGDFWLHDACAVAVYVCRECFEPNALVNQA